MIERGTVVGNILNRAGTALLALTLAVIVWLVSTNQANPSVKDVFPDPVPVEVRNKPAGMVVFGDIVDRVQVTIRAPRSSWDNLRAGSFQAWIDLTGLNADIHDVNVQVKCSDRAVNILETRPSKIAVRLEVLKEKQLEVKPIVLDSPPLGYIYRAPTVTPISVTVRGPGSVVDQVESVVADIYLQGAKSDLERTVAVLPHNAQGETVAWAELDPPRVDVKVPIEQRIGYKDASVRVILQGQVARGYRITNVSVDPSVVTVVGEPGPLSKIEGYLEIKPIDVTDAKADVVERVTLALPEGVSLLGTQSVMVTVSVLPLEGGLTLQGLPLTWQGLAPDMIAKASPDAVDVILSGPLPRLEPLTRDEVQVILDVYGLAPGVHKVAPTVMLPEGLKAESVLPDMVEVRIEPKLPLGSTATPTLSASATVTGTADGGRAPTVPPTVLPPPESPVLPTSTPAAGR